MMTDVCHPSKVHDPWKTDDKFRRILSDYDTC